MADRTGDYTTNAESRIQEPEIRMFNLKPVPTAHRAVAATAKEA
jgi:hypothetical protein